MTCYTEIFKRKEVKYRLNTEQFRLLTQELSFAMRPDDFGRTRVNSLYYDTPDHQLIARSLEKPLYKEKLRLRWYGNSVETPVFTEIKKKYKGIVYKRRVVTSRQAAQAWATGLPYMEACQQFPLPDIDLQAASLSPLSQQMAHEIETMRMRYQKLEPSALIECQRTAWTLRRNSEERPIWPFDQELRITFDEELRGTDLITADPHPVALTNDGEVVMEIKSVDSMPLWLVQVLNDAHAHPSSFSKYGELYKKGFVHA